MSIFNQTDELFKGIGQGASRGPSQPFATGEAQQEQDDPSLLFDIAAAPFRGLEGAAHGLYNLADTIGFDLLPDWDEEDRLLGRSKTMAGGFVEGLSQFLIPFFPLKAAMKAGKVGQQFAKLGGKKSDIARDITAGSITDFAAFDGHEERLSNLINTFPALRNPVTEYLEAEADDAELEGRLKNTMEGLLIEGGVRGTFGMVKAAMNGVRAVKLRKQKIAEGKDPDVATDEALNESGAYEDTPEQMEFGFAADYDTPSAYGMRSVEDLVGEQMMFDFMDTNRPVQRELFDENGEAIPTPTKVFHGSPHSFDSFNINKVGGGEGNQAFGYGLYFAGDPYVAGHYTEFFNHQGEGRFYDVELNVKEEDMVEYDESFKTLDPAKREKVRKAFYNAVVDFFTEFRNHPLTWSRNYDIEEAIDELGFTDVDNIEDYYRSFGELYRYIVDREFIYGDEGIEDILNEQPRAYAEFNYLQNTLNKKLSEALQKEGFSGIKYLDGNSRHRDAKRNNYNYVVFDDKLVQITRRDGEAVDPLKGESKPFMNPEIMMTRPFTPERQMILRRMKEEKKPNPNQPSDSPRYFRAFEYLNLINRLEDDPELRMDTNFQLDENGAFREFEEGVKNIINTDAAGFASSDFSMGYRDLRPIAKTEQGNVIAIGFEDPMDAGEVFLFHKGEEIELGRYDVQKADAVEKLKKDAQAKIDEMMKADKKPVQGEFDFTYERNPKEIRVQESESISTLANANRRTRTITFNSKKIAEDFEKGMPYIRGAVEGTGSAQKKLVFQDIDLEKFKQVINTPERYKEFIRFHEEGHILIQQGEKYNHKNLSDEYNVALEREVNEYAAKQMGIDWEGVHKEGKYKAPDDLKVDAQTTKARKGLSVPDVAQMSYKQLQGEAKKLGLGGKGSKAELKSKILGYYNKPPNMKVDKETGQGEFFAGEGMGKAPNPKRSGLYRQFLARQGKGGKSEPTKDMTGTQGEFEFAKRLDPTKNHYKSLEETVKNVAQDLLNRAKETGGKGVRGLEMALAGSVRNLSSQGNLMILAKALAKNIEESIEQPSKTFDEIVDQAKADADEMGVSKHDQLAKVYAANEKGLDSMKKVRAEQSALRMLNHTIANALRDKAEQVHKAYTDGARKGDKGFDELEVELLELVEQLKATQQAWSVYGREISEAFLARKAYYRGTKYNRRLTLGQQRMNAADRLNYRKKAIGSMKTMEMVEKIRQQKDPSKVYKTINGLVKGTDGNKMMNITLEYWMNSLLSSPITQLVNGLGALGLYHLKAAEEFVGAAIARDANLMKAVAANIYKNESIVEAWGMFKEAMKRDDSILFPDARVYDDSVERGHAIYKEGDDAYANAINWLGTVVRLPSRTLLAGDEFFKQLNYRYFVRSSAYYDALNKGFSPKKAAERAEDVMSMSVTKNNRALNERNVGMEAYEFVNRQDDLRAERGEPRMTEDQREQEFVKFYEQHGAGLHSKALGMDNVDPRHRLPEAAAEYARINTATKDIPQIQEPLGRLAHYFPPMKMVFPFVRTPTNLLKMGFERTPLGGIAQIIREGSHGKFLEQVRDKVTNGTPREVAQQYGLMATTVATTSALIAYISANGQFITGGGPRSREEQEALRMQGWQPYSIKIGDTWVSYKRLDPISTTLGILADLAETPKYYDWDQGTVENGFTLFSVAFMNNITNQSFVEGIDNLFKVVRDPVTYGPQFVGSIAGGFVPNAVNYTQNFGEDRLLRDTRSWFDYTLKRMPSQASKLPPKRNIFGEPQYVENGMAGLGAINPFWLSSISDNPEDKEIASLLHGFSMPEHKLGNAENLNLKRMKTQTGQDAYDRYLELSGTVKLGGKTLREQIRELVKNPAYQLLPTDDVMSDTGMRNPRVKEISKIIRFYRVAARQQLIEEMPSLQEAMYSNAREKYAYLTQ